MKASGLAIVLALAVPRAAQAQAEALPPAVAPEPLPPPAPLLPSPAVPPPPAPAAAPMVVGRDRGLLIIPYVGLNLPAGTLGDSYSAGLRCGALLGWQLKPRLSLNGEGTLDLMDADGDSSFLASHEHYLDFTLSPLLHYRSGAIAIGPKLGWFINSRSRSASSELPPKAPTVVVHSGQGFLVGINAGGFVPLGRLSAGMLVSGTFGRFLIGNCDGRACGSELGNVLRLGFVLAARY